MNRSRRRPAKLKINGGWYVRAFKIAYEDSCEAALDRLAAKLHCETHQVEDRITQMLKEKPNQ